MRGTGRLGGGLVAVVMLVAACAAQPPQITSAGTIRVDVDPNAPPTTTPPATTARTSPDTIASPVSTVPATPGNQTTSSPRTTRPTRTTQPTTTTMPPRPTVPPTTPKERVKLLCDSFLLSQGNVYESVYLDAMENVRHALRPGAPERVRNAVDTLIAEDRIAAGRRNRLTAIVEQEVVGACRARYFAGVEPHEDVVHRFFNLVIAGRREPAETVAPAHVIARFEPWQPWPSTELISPGLRIQNDTSFIMALSETVEARCTHFSGTIRSCFLSLSN